MGGERRRPRGRGDWNEIYEESELPWDSGVVDVHLAGVLARHGIEPGKALEIGCGTGTNTIWLAKHGFKMTSLDIAQNAIVKAGAKIAAAGVRCRVLVGDFLAVEVLGAPYRFVYDRGVFHVFETGRRGRASPLGSRSCSGPKASGTASSAPPTAPRVNPVRRGSAPRR
jgi:SAM-dependent methyltransferase